MFSLNCCWDVNVLSGPCEQSTEPGLAGGGMQAVIENHQTYFIDRKSWFAKKVFPEKVDLDVTTTLLITETVSCHPAAAMPSLHAKVSDWCHTHLGKSFPLGTVRFDPP